jgi:hypothetical protein
VDLGSPRLLREALAGIAHLHSPGGAQALGVHTPLPALIQAIQNLAGIITRVVCLLGGLTSARTCAVPVSVRLTSGGMGKDVMDEESEHA